MSKMIRIVKDELKLIEDYIKTQDFLKKETTKEVLDLFLVMVGHEIEPSKAVDSISRIVNAIKSEYGE